VQDSFISAWMALHRYDNQKVFAVWLRAIALNKCRDFGRRQTVRRRFLRLFGVAQTESAAAGIDEVAAIRERDKMEEVRLKRLDQAIVGLPPFYKEPLLLTTIGGLSQQEAAQQLNTTTKAIEMRLRRARKQLGTALADLTYKD
jgi:RNA polymerase sigma-70 factor (ECF subfamily)